MYKQVLFAIDGGPASRAAIPVVAQYARASGAAVRVLHVVRLNGSHGGPQARGLVRSFVDALSEVGVTAGGQVHVVREGTVADAIAREALDGDADLVAIASRGFSDLGTVFLRSVSHRVASELDLPVLVVRTRPGARTELKRVLVCVDGSLASEEAVATAAEFAGGSGAEARVLYVRKLLTAQGAAVVLAGEVEADAIVTRAAAQLRKAGMQADVETAVGNSVAATIAAAAERWGADVVVLASRRPSGLNGLLLGSVAHQTIHALRLPVLLAGRKSVSGLAAARWGAHHEVEPAAGMR